MGGAAEGRDAASGTGCAARGRGTGGAAHHDLRSELACVDVGGDGGEASEEGTEGESAEGDGGETEDVVGPREGQDGREAEQRDEQQRRAVARIREGVVQRLDPGGRHARARAQLRNLRRRCWVGGRGGWGAGAGRAAHCGDSCAASSTSCLPKLLETPKEIEAEMVEQVSTTAVPLTPPKMAPAETVRMKAAAIGTTCATQSVQQDGGGRWRGEGSGRGIRAVAPAGRS